jgi:hypothetical protein
MDLCTTRGQDRVWLSDGIFAGRTPMWECLVRGTTILSNTDGRTADNNKQQLSTILATCLQPGKCNNRVTKQQTISLRMKSKDALSSNFIGITTLHILGSLSAHHQEFLAVHRHWYNLCSLVTECYHAQDGTAPGSSRSPNCITCTNADVRLKTPDDGQKDCPKHVQSWYQ